jgi:hypothetical protein
VRATLATTQSSLKATSDLLDEARHEARTANDASEKKKKSYEQVCEAVVWRWWCETLTITSYCTLLQHNTEPATADRRT